jgi:hypothetical protein
MHTTAAVSGILECAAYPQIKKNDLVNYVLIVISKSQVRSMDLYYL